MKYIIEWRAPSGTWRPLKEAKFSKRLMAEVVAKQMNDEFGGEGDEYRVKAVPETTSKLPSYF